MKIISEIKNAFLLAREYLLSDGIREKEIVKKNPSGDISRMFDIKAETIIINHLRKAFPAYGIISEEAGEINIKDCRKFFIIDPVDGSFNFIRNIGNVGCSIALLEDSMSLKNLTHGFVGNYFTGDVFTSIKSCGSFYNGKRLKCNDEIEINKIVLGIDFDHGNPKNRKNLFKIITRVKTIRYLGSASLDLCNVAKGAYDAYIDIRDDLTPENFCAAKLIIEEAKGILTDKQGVEITKFSMNDRYSIVCSSNNILNKKIIEVCN